MATFKFQLVSDLHMEMMGQKLPKIPVTAPYLFLAGDIGNFKKGSLEEYLGRVAAQYEKVIYVLGNHEFYGHKYDTTRARTQDICDKFENVILLDPGCTLWSFVPEDKKMDVLRGLNDYRLIAMDKEGEEGKLRPITVEETNKWHLEELAFIKEELQKAREAQEPVILLTHHTPLVKGTSDPKFDGSACNCAFSTDLGEMLEDPIRVWCFGHTHYSSDRIMPNGVRVVSNQLGYQTFYAQEEGFDPEMFIEVKL